METSTNFNTIGGPSSFKGELNAVGDTIIYGHGEGHFHIQNGTLTIEREANVNGHIEAENVEILGRFEGKIIATGRVILRSGAWVEANIQAKDLVIYPGAQANLKADSL